MKLTDVRRALLTLGNSVIRHETCNYFYTKIFCKRKKKYRFSQNSNMLYVVPTLKNINDLKSNCELQ